MSYILDIASFAGLVIFSWGCSMAYKPLGPIMLGLGIMLFCIKLSSIKMKVNRQ